MTAIEQQGSGENGGRPPWYVLLALGLLLAHLWPVFLLMSGIYENMPDFSHGYFVPVVSIYVVVSQWHRRKTAPLGPQRLGFPIFLVGLLLTVVCIWYEWALYPAGTGASMLGGFGIIALVLGGSITLFGLRRTLVYSFALAFLFLAVPYPDSLSNKITIPMRAMISVMAEWSLSATGVYVYREGNVLELANVSLGVEDACSGIRSLWASLASGIAIAYLTGCKGFRMLLVVAMSIFLAVLQNLGRIYLSGVAANYWGVEWAEGWRHETLGIITLTLALLALLGFALKVAPPWEDEQAESKEEESVPWWGYLAQQKRLLMALSVCLAVALGTRIFIQRHYVERDQQLLAREAARLPLEDFPRQLGRFNYVPEATEAWNMERQLPELKPTDYFQGVYTSREGVNICPAALLGSAFAAQAEGLDLPALPGSLFSRYWLDLDRGSGARC